MSHQPDSLAFFAGVLAFEMVEMEPGSLHFVNPSYLVDAI